MNKTQRAHNIYYQFLLWSQVTPKLFDKICVAWNLNPQEFSDLRIGGIPSLKVNWLYCDRLFQSYGDLSVIPGFKQHRFGGYLLDVDERLSNYGFILPIRNTANLITRLQIYRGIDDARPFILRTRKENVCVAA